MTTLTSWTQWLLMISRWCLDMIRNPRCSRHSGNIHRLRDQKAKQVRSNVKVMLTCSLTHMVMHHEYVPQVKALQMNYTRRSFFAIVMLCNENNRICGQRTIGGFIISSHPPILDIWFRVSWPNTTSRASSVFAYLYPSVFYFLFYLFLSYLLPFFSLFMGMLLYSCLIVIPFVSLSLNHPLLFRPEDSTNIPNGSDNHTHNSNNYIQVF